MPPFERAPNNSTAQRRIVIVGGVAGGASAAARARRLDENASIIVFEKGPDPSFANCGMPYHLGGEIEDRAKLNVQTPASLKARLNLDVRTLTEVLSINRDAKTVTVVEYETKRQYSEPYDDLILSVGAKPFMPPIPGIDRKGNFALRNLQDMDQIDDWLRESGAKRAVVAGAGFIGVEMAEQLKRRGLHVTLIEAAPQIMAPVDVEVAALLQQELERNGVAVRVADAVAAFEPPTDGAQGSDLLLKSGGRLHADVVILGLGVRAESALARDAGLELSARGGIVVDEHLRTKDPAIWAVGDAIEVRNPTLGDSWMVAMAGPANRQGRMVADNILAAPDTPLRAYRGTLGTSVLRCFSLTCACTGVNERTLKSRGASYKAVHTWPMSHAGYYPGAAPMLLKLLFEPASGRVLGAQAVGPDKVEKRIDVVATAMHGGMTVDDLAQLELCYAPPFGGAKDPVNLAGMVAQDVRDGLVETCTWDEAPALCARPGTVVVDVRSGKERASNGLVAAASLHVPVDELRARLAELPPPAGATLLLHCESGQRSYYAAQILRQRGYRCVNLLGGNKLWQVCAARQQLSQ